MKIQNKGFLLLFIALPLFIVSGVSAADIPSPLKLIFEDRVITLNFAYQPSLLTAVPQHVLPIAGTNIPLDFLDVAPPELSAVKIEAAMFYRVDRANLESFVGGKISLLDLEADSVNISQNEEGWVAIKGFPKSGFTVDFDLLEPLINRAILAGHEYVRVPADKTYSSVIADEGLLKRGIKEVVAIGHSNFKGSPAARRQNIRVSAQLYNGLIIKQGEAFSFNQILGSVGPEQGYLEELVIKGNDTEKEYGGGICQVSSTVFRAAFNGGLDINQRRNHSYAVPYYQPYGLDATIYLGSQDFKFTNDTPGDLLIQTAVYGDNMYFVFYGTDDGRKVVTNGPFISGHKAAPEPIVTETTVLAPGVREQMSSAHDGFNASWVREIEASTGEIKKDTFASYYKAWPARVFVGAGEVDLGPESTVAIPPIYPDYADVERSTFAE